MPPKLIWPTFPSSSTLARMNVGNQRDQGDEQRAGERDAVEDATQVTLGLWDRAGCRG